MSEIVSLLQSRSAEDIQYAEEICPSIIEWAAERYQKSKQLDFKLSECKDRFKTVTDVYLMLACELLQKRKQLDIDNNSRITKYSFFPAISLLQSKAKPAKPVPVREPRATGKRKLSHNDEDDDVSDLSEAEDEERKENVPKKQLKIEKSLPAVPPPSTQRIILAQKPSQDHLEQFRQWQKLKEVVVVPAHPLKPVVPQLKPLFTVTDLSSTTTSSNIVVPSIATSSSSAGNSSRFFSDAPAGTFSDESEFDRIKDLFAATLITVRDSHDSMYERERLPELVREKYPAFTEAQCDFMLKKFDNERKISFDEFLVYIV
jgi:hypothetical protein